MNFNGKTVIVTGGARGIGRAIVNSFAEAGADVVISDLRCDEAKTAALNTSETHHRSVVAIQTDVTKREDVERLRAETLGQFGKIDVLVNCAGWDRLLPFIKTTPDLWQKILSINFLGVANTCYVILPASD